MNHTRSVNPAQPLPVYPVISALAIRVGLAAPMRLYDLVQSIARHRNGSPFFTRADLTALNLLTHQQIDRALRDGLDLFWTRTNQGDYHMTSRAKVAAALGFAGKPGRVVMVPAEAFTGRLSNWKAATYAAYLGQLHRATPSREQLCETFGVTLPTLLDWECRTNVVVRPRIVMVDPAAFDGATGQQDQQAAVYDEIEANSGPRKWITILGPRGGIKAGRRLMDDHNVPLDDYWQTIEAPAWEIDATPMMTWQTTNHYASSLDAAPKGRGSWLRAEIKRINEPESRFGSPDVDATGGKPDRVVSALGREPTWKTRPGWHDDGYRAAKWQGRKMNRARPAVIRRVQRSQIVGQWWPSRAAQWAEKGY